MDTGDGKKPITQVQVSQVVVPESREVGGMES